MTAFEKDAGQGKKERSSQVGCQKLHRTISEKGSRDKIADALLILFLHMRDKFTASKTLHWRFVKLLSDKKKKMKRKKKKKNVKTSLH